MGTLLVIDCTQSVGRERRNVSAKARHSKPYLSHVCSNSSWLIKINQNLGLWRHCLSVRILAGDLEQVMASFHMLQHPTLLY